MKRRIRAISFDFDNCLFHTGYVWNKNNHPDPNEIILKNLPLLEDIRSQNHAFEENICFVGSNRQSKLCDDENSAFVPAPTESCFSALEKVSAFIEARIDPFLLADIYGNAEDGQSFRQALSENADALTHPNWIFDKSKLSILYAQMHKLAAAYPDDEIVYDFYDDKRLGQKFKRPMDPLLENLERYFTRFPEIIPKNVTLRLNHYAGQTVTPYKPIQGQGPIDINYRKTIKEMANIARQATPLPRNAIYSFIDSVLPQALKNREALMNIEMQKCNRHGSWHNYYSLFNPFKPSLVETKNEVATTFNNYRL